MPPIPHLETPTLTLSSRRRYYPLPPPRPRLGRLRPLTRRLTAFMRSVVVC